VSDNTTQILGYLDKIAAKITAVAPLVWDQMVRVVHMESVANLILGGLLLVVGITIPVIGWNIVHGMADRTKQIALLRKELDAIPVEDRHKRHELQDEISTAIRNNGDIEDYRIFVFALIIGAVLSIISAGALFNIWNWIGAFAPDARLVHQIMEAAAR